MTSKPPARHHRRNRSANPPLTESISRNLLKRTRVRVRFLRSHRGSSCRHNALSPCRTSF
jgi:hypothetical protein